MMQSRVPHLLTKGRALEQQKRYDEALALYDRILASAPNDLGACQRKAWVLIQLKRNDDALTALDLALAIDPNEAWAAALRAKTLHRLGRLDEADEAADRAIKLAPDYVYAHMTKSYIARALKNDDKALLHAARALELDPASAEAALQKAAALYRMRRFEESLPFFELAERLDPEEDNPCYWRGRALGELGRYEEALSAYERAAELTPDAPRVWYWKAFALRELNRHEEALAVLDEALKREPENPDAYRGKAFSLIKLKRREESIAACQKAIEFEPGDHWAWHALAAESYNIGRYEESVDAWQHVVSLSADMSAKALAWRHQAEALIRVKRYDEALRAATEAITLDASVADAWKAKADALAALDRPEEAVVAQERAVALKPDDSAARTGQVRILLWAGHFDEALLAAERLVTLQPDNPESQEYLKVARRALRRETEDRCLILRDGRRLQYVELGDPAGLPVIVCHGSPGSRLDSESFADTFREQGMRVISPDRPGYGGSQAKRRMRLLDWPEDIRQLADGLGLQNFAVLGVSGGGAYAAACAHALPERIAALGLVSSAAPQHLSAIRRRLTRRQRLHGVAGSLLPWLALRLIHSLMARLVRRYPEAWYSLIGQWIAPETAARPKRLSPTAIESLKEEFAQGDLGGSIDIRLLRRPWRFDVKDIAVPTYLWHGERDPLAPPIFGHYLAEHIPNCHATFYPEEGHAVFASHDREILATLADVAQREVATEHDEP